ncbi:MAG: hypothetical protein D6753_17715 [Planctomycetota bacterium]|nr:MAG: hypothetical protein D6753_17715 [Planctomycetota bacterium]
MNRIGQHGVFRGEQHCLVVLCLTVAVAVLLDATTSSSIRAQSQSTSESTDAILFHRPPRTGDVWNGPQHRQIHGNVSRFDAEVLTVATEDGQVRNLASDQVDRVVPRWANEQAAHARRLVQQRQFRAAIPALEQAVRSGIPRWQQRLLIADLVRSVASIGKTRSAGTLFLNLAASHPPPALYADMPLCWTTQEPDVTLRDAARQWLASDDPHAQLLGASWLLSGASRGEAEAGLRRLESSSVEIVAQLARWQRRRLTPPPESLERMPTWMAERDALLGPLQLGPTEFMAERLAQTGQIELAVGQWMRIVTQHQDRYHRWQAAVEQVESALQRLGNPEQAERFQAWIDQAPQF